MKDKIITFTLDNPDGMNLISKDMEAICAELEATAPDYFKENPTEKAYEVTIRIEKRMTQRQFENLPEYDG